MQSGQQTLAGIEEALRDLKTQQASISTELETANRERVGLVADRLTALRRLAAIRARDASEDGVIDAADNLSHQVRGILEARLRTIKALEERQTKAEVERATQVARQDEQTRRIAVLEERLDHFGTEARSSLAQDKEHSALVEAHDRLSATLAKAVDKAEQVTRDEHEKGLPYRNDPLFMYLWRRQIGASQYQASGLVRMLDEWVARLVKYPEARANYALLTEIPVRLRAHAEDLRRQVQAAKMSLDEMEGKRTRELAGSDLIAELRRERERQTELDNEFERITSELAETGNQLKVYAKGEDQSFIAAVAAYAAFLEREPLRRLMGQAAATATKADDMVVEDVRRLGQVVDDLEAGNVSRRRRLDQIAERQVELARLASNFRRQRYDDVGSEFNDSPRVEDLLQMLLRGAITAADYWMRMQQQQNWKHRPGDPWRRQSGLPPFGGFPSGWGGGFGGGRKRDDDDDDDDDDDRRRRGGFSTGGSF